VKLRAKMPGTSTSFVDSAADEALLQFSWGGAGAISLAFHIYDAQGTLVADSGGVFPVAAVCIQDATGELLLNVPADPEEHIFYRLYSSTGKLLTTSDGAHTQIFAFLRMEPKRLWPGLAEVLETN
jgi:hypothetical protein